MMNKKVFLLRKVVSGLLTYMPFFFRILMLFRTSLTGQSPRLVHSTTASYCYAIWLRHLIHFMSDGRNHFPATVVEIGPGDSLGVGLAALLSGVDRYYALDAVTHLDFRKNEAMLDDLIALFDKQSPIPDHETYPELGPPLPSYAFPDHFLSSRHMMNALDKMRLQSIRNGLTGLSSPDEHALMAYFIPGKTVFPQAVYASADLILSQFVMEHIDDVSAVYEQCSNLLKPGGIMSHHIDFRSHWTSDVWDGHWAYEDRLWRIIRGNRSYFINRLPLSGHLSCLRDMGFEVLHIYRKEGAGNVLRKQLAKRFRRLTDDDLCTMCALIIARKPCIQPFN